jgi:hypothetical protein
MPPASACPDEPSLDPGPTLVRRLTNNEYDRTVRDLLGVPSSPAAGFPPEETTRGFRNQAAALQVAPLHVERYLESAEILGRAAAQRMDTLLPCEPGAERDDALACGDAFIRDFGPRAWRRPLSDSEIAGLNALFTLPYEVPDGFEGPAFEAGFTLVVETMLQSPYFLYRIEIGEPAEAAMVEASGVEGLHRLTGYEVASRLSYLLWQSMPDDVLFEAAADGTLDTPEGVLAEAKRMLEDPRAGDGLMEFFRQWLEFDRITSVEKDPRLFPNFDRSLLVSMRDELEWLLADHVFVEGRDFRDVFSTRRARVDAALARIYGVDLFAPDEDGYAEVKLDPRQRAGILTRAALLAVKARPHESDPIHRGLFVRQRMLCDVLPPPPPGLAIVPPDPDPDLTTRERFAAHSDVDGCRSCHALIDPPGFAFEHYDAIGAWRETENGRPIDASGELVSAMDLGRFTDAVDLSEQMRQSDQVQRCITMQFFRFAMGRAESEADGCRLTRLHAEYVDDGHRFLTLVEALVGDPAFGFRRMDVAEEGAE